jgi:hypothetical protein
LGKGSARQSAPVAGSLEFRGRELGVVALGVQSNGGRICDVAGVGGTDERVIAFDAEARMMAYSVRASGLPFFVDRLENTWPVSDDGHGGASVDVEIRGITKGIIGRVGVFPLGRILGTVAVGLPSDLKAHVETAAAGHRDLPVGGLAHVNARSVGQMIRTPVRTSATPVLPTAVAVTLTRRTAPSP